MRDDMFVQELIELGFTLWDGPEWMRRQYVKRFELSGFAGDASDCLIFVLRRVLPGHLDQHGLPVSQEILEWADQRLLSDAVRQCVAAMARTMVA